MNVLITNLTLAGRTGTEIVTRDLALGLLRAGHRPSVYSPALGPLAEELRARGIPVTRRIDSIRRPPDIIHGHHTFETLTAAARFPHTPAIFVCHDFVAWHDEPPRLPNIGAYAAISEGFKERLVVQSGVDPERACVILNGVDTERFLPGPALPAKPKRALAFAKNRGHISAVTTACRALGISIDVVGPAVGSEADQPEKVLQDYDLVFASALTCLEALAVGRAVVVCDGRGLAGMVDLERYSHWRRQNFGLPVMTDAVSSEGLIREIARYQPAESQRVSERVRAEATIEATVDAYVGLYEKVIRDYPAREADLTETLRDVSLAFERWSPGRQPPAWIRERDLLSEQCDRLGSGLSLAPPGIELLRGARERVHLIGFHDMEPWGAWSSRPSTSAIFRAKDQEPRRLIIRFVPYFGATRQAYSVGCSLNGRSLGAVDLSREQFGPKWTVVTRSFEIPGGLNEGLNWITFECDSRVALRAEGLPDSRTIGFGLAGLAYE